MSEASTGTGKLDWAGITGMRFYSPDGFTVMDVDTGVTDCTPDDATSKEWTPGDKPNYGQCTGTLIVLTQSWEDLTAAIDGRTVAELVYTGPLQGSGTAGTATGQAFIATMSLTSEENGVCRAAVAFQWQSKPTIVNEVV